jgi:hypothetical protein
MDYITRYRLMVHSRNSSANAKAGQIKVLAGHPGKAPRPGAWVAIDGITPDNDAPLIASPMSSSCCSP